MISSHVQCMALLLAHGFLFFFNDAAPTEIYTLSLHDALRSSVTELRERLQAALGDAYRIEKELGGGGMSHVFLAVEVRLGREVVVKVLPPALAAGVSADRFKREIQLAAKLQHPHTVPPLTAGSRGDPPYYVMPHIAGESLRARI